MSIRLATFNVENLFARAKALDTTAWSQGRAALEAFETFNRIAAQRDYSDHDRAVMLRALETLRIVASRRLWREGARIGSAGSSWPPSRSTRSPRG